MCILLWGLVTVFAVVSVVFINVNVKCMLHGLRFLRGVRGDASLAVFLLLFILNVSVKSGDLVVSGLNEFK